MLTLSRTLCDFGPAPRGAALLTVCTRPRDHLSVLRLAMFLREEADAGEITACRRVGGWENGGPFGQRLDGQTGAVAFETQDDPFDLHQGRLVRLVLAARDPDALVRLAKSCGLEARRLGWQGKTGLLGARPASGAPWRSHIAATPHRNGRSPSPP
jgi:hypothetical protein